MTNTFTAYWNTHIYTPLYIVALRLRNVYLMCCLFDSNGGEEYVADAFFSQFTGRQLDL